MRWPAWNDGGHLRKAGKQAADWLLAKHLLPTALKSLKGLQKAKRLINSVGCWLR